MNTYMEGGGISSPFLNSVLDGGEWSALCPDRFTPRVRALGTHWIGGWVSIRAYLYAMEKRKILPMSGIEPRSSSPYPVTVQLSYPGST
jgi:hypothetical protein